MTLQNKINSIHVSKKSIHPELIFNISLVYPNMTHVPTHVGGILEVHGKKIADLKRVIPRNQSNYEGYYFRSKVSVDNAIKSHFDNKFDSYFECNLSAQLSPLTIDFLEKKRLSNTRQDIDLCLEVTFDLLNINFAKDRLS